MEASGVADTEWARAARCRAQLVEPEVQSLRRKAKCLPLRKMTKIDRVAEVRGRWSDCRGESFTARALLKAKAVTSEI